MASVSRPLVILSCLALLALQAVGLHLHANVGAEGLDLHAAHIHGADPDGHDHSADVDVSVVELGTLWAKLSALLILFCLVLACPAVVGWRVKAPQQLEVPQASSERWRPPLRAPPQSA